MALWSGVLAGTGADRISLREDIMFGTIAIVLLVLWLLGFVVVPVGGSLIHLLLVVALIAFIWQMMSGRRSRV